MAFSEKIKMGNVVLYLVAILFFVSSLILTVGIPDMYNSPDERANAFFVGEFIETTSLIDLEPLNQTVGQVIAPRSIVAIGPVLIPSSFIGLPIVYGLIGKLIGLSLVHIITPLLAILAVFAWKRTLEASYSQRTALIGSVLLFFVAAFWFYSARVMMHNIPFISFFIFGIYFLAHRPISRRISRADALKDLPTVPLHYGDVLFAGLAIGVSLFFRTSEWFWMFLVGISFLSFYPRALNWRQLILFVVGIAVAVSPFFFWNSSIFGHPLITGYSATPSISPAEVVSDGPAILPVLADGAITQIKSFLFPFGIHLRAAWRNFINYQVEITWWMTILILIGLPFLFAPKRGDPTQTKASQAILVATFLGGLYLTILYGSWNIFDNPDPTAITLANSYMRYWLPIFLVSTIPAALAIDWLMSFGRTKTAQILIALAILLPVGTLSARLVFFHPDDGLTVTRGVLIENLQLRDDITSLTEADSIIVVDRADKILFPERKVVQPLRSEDTYAALPTLFQHAPLYYFGITLPKKDIDFLQETQLTPIDLTVSPVQTFGIQTLYKFERL